MIFEAAKMDQPLLCGQGKARIGLDPYWLVMCCRRGERSHFEADAAPILCSGTPSYKCNFAGVNDILFQRSKVLVNKIFHAFQEVKRCLVSNRLRDGM